MSQILNALKALVSRIPFDKVAAFLKWASDIASKMASKTAAQVAKVVAFIKENPKTIVDWFFKGITAIDVINRIL